MKCYKAEAAVGVVTLVNLHELYQDEGMPYWRHIGLLLPDRAAKQILLAITQQVDLAIDNAERFERHFLDLRTLPRTISEVDVFAWIEDIIAGRL